MTRHDADSLIGSVRDGRYRLEALLGEGSVGAVYRAVDETTGERIAFKQWHAMSLNAEVHQRFEREAIALLTLDHPHIVKVRGHGFIDGVPYVALEYLEGQTLEALLRDGEPMEPQLALALARQALAAVAYAHTREVVHRDLKPENIFVTRDARGEPVVKLLDYGLAKFMASDAVLGGGHTPLTGIGTRIGTPLYMPPEQAAGSSVDLAVDVYSMGCVIFEMLTGRPPFMAETNLALITAHMTAPIPKLSHALPRMQVAPALQALIDHALAKRQTERFPNAGAMLEALSALPPSPITAARVELEHALDTPAAARAGRAWIVAAAVASVALVALLVRAC